MSDNSAGRTLFSGVNWLGDSVMAMPAICEFRRRNPSQRTTMLVKPALAPLWSMSPDIDEVIELPPGPAGALTAARAVRRGRFDRAFVLTQSFRSAMVPFIAGVPTRIGMPGHFRDWMLTAVVKPALSGNRQHQAFEYLDLMGMGDVTKPTANPLSVPDAVSASCRQRLADQVPDKGGQPLVGILPGAAHGSSKRWPLDRFAEVARRLVSEHGCRIAVFGSQSEMAACSRVADAAGCPSSNLAGTTSLPQLAAFLSLCDAALSNDSGGMHLAALAATPVAAIFGITDPNKTGPLGNGHRILTGRRTTRSRDLPPESREAAESLKEIEPATACEAILDILRHRAAGRTVPQ